MSIPAIFEDGVFKPIEAVDLPERTRVMIDLSQTESPAALRTPSSGSDEWSLHLVRWIADDFDKTPSGFEEYMP